MFLNLKNFFKKKCFLQNFTPTFKNGQGCPFFIFNPKFYFIFKKSAKNRVMSLKLTKRKNSPKFHEHNFF